MLHLDYLLKLVMTTVLLALLIFNLAFIIMGILMYYQKAVFSDMDEGLAKSLEVKALLMGVDVDTEEVNIGIFLQPLGSYLLLFGILGAILCFLCFVIWSIDFLVCGAGKLIFFPLMVLHLLLSILILTYTSPREETEVKINQKESVLFKIMNSTLEEYKGLEHSDRESVTWSAVMAEMKCCGVEGYQDFEGHKNWLPQRTIRDTNVNLTTPLMCCKASTPDYSCASQGTANPDNNWWDVGCFTKIWNYAMSNYAIILPVALYVTLQVVFIITCVLALLMTVTSTILPSG